MGPLRQLMTLVALVSATSWFGVGVLGGTSQPRARLVHQFKKDQNTYLADVSADGKRVLTKSSRLIECTTGRRCYIQVLSVYDTDTGKLIWEHASLPSQYSTAEKFLEPAKIARVEGQKIVQLDLNSNHESLIALPNSEEFSPSCIVDSTRVLGASLAPPNSSSRAVLKVADQIGLNEIPQPRFARTVFDVLRTACKSARVGHSILLPSGTDPPINPNAEYLSGRGQKTDLYWISTTLEPERLCCSFADEFLYGYTLSPDGQLIVAITGVMERTDLLFSGQAKRGQGTCRAYFHESHRWSERTSAQAL
jgi:hypothetical protein